MTDNLIIKKESLTAIADAIRKKTGKTATMTVSQMKDEIESIEAGGGIPKFTDLSYFYANGARYSQLKPELLDTSKATTMSNIFKSNSFVTALDLSAWDVKNVATMAYAFSDCTNLKTLNLTGWNTRQVSSMISMFESCKSLDMSCVKNLDTSKVKDMSAMFKYCSCETLDLSHFKTDRVTRMGSMFYYCNKLKSLNLTGWDTNGVTYMRDFVYSSMSLTDIYIKDSELRADGQLKFKLSTSGVFDQIRTNGGKIHLSKTLESNYKSATNWSAYTDIMEFDQP